jgi:hypothetical protein
MKNYRPNSVRHAYAALDAAIPRDLRELPEGERLHFKLLLEYWLRELAAAGKRDAANSHETAAR